MTWCSVDKATPRFDLASSAIRCRFVDRFVRLKVLSHVARQRFSPRGAPLPSIGSRRGPVPQRHKHYEGATTPIHASRSLICFTSGSRTIPPQFVFASQRSRADGASASGQDSLFGRRSLLSGSLIVWTWVGSLRFPGDPSCAFAPV